MVDSRETGGDYCGTIIAYEDLIACAEGARVETRRDLHKLTRENLALLIRTDKWRVRQKKSGAGSSQEEKTADPE